MAAKPQVVPLHGAEVPAKIPAADEPDVPNPRSGPTLPSSKRTSPTPSPPGTPVSQRTTPSAQPATPRVPSPLGRAPVSVPTSPHAEGGEEPLPRVHSAPRRAGDPTIPSPPAAVPVAAGPGTPLRFARPAPPGLLIRTGFSASTGSLDSRPLRGSPLREAVTVSDDGESDDGDDEDSDARDGEDSDDSDSDDEMGDGEKTAGASKSSSNPPQPSSQPYRSRGVSSKHSIGSRSVSRRKSRTVSSTCSGKEGKGSHATLFKTPATMPEDHRPDGITDRVIRYVNEMRSTAMDPAQFGFLSRLHFWTLLLGWGVSLVDWYAIINAVWNYAWLADARAAAGYPPGAGGHRPASVVEIGQDPAMLVHGIALSMLFVSICKEGLKIVAFGALLAQANEHMSSWLYALCTHSLWLFPTILVSKVHQRRVLTSAALVSHPRVVMPDLFLTDLPLCMEAVLRVMYQPSWFLFANAVIILASTSFHMSRLIWMVILSLNEYGNRRQRIQSRQSAVEKWIHEVQTTVGLVGASSQRDQFLLALTDPSATLAQSSGTTKGSILKRATTWLSRGDSPTTSLGQYLPGFLGAPLLMRRRGKLAVVARIHQERSQDRG
ncbi:hypothetical protein AMAG_04950 [Allomyces macrogynus ATCC 38327]|uniref:Uncharacterized protein n=1 Tax=Allomyces macrogynus (strain ATCC 38327) TaxID=578462 RepID=A0A0L0S730_ALLM3|nr:hypothetical protein AMAG_04950 [Allomyces macrogynus ATCC 38327]|eukprot:KNE58134.1 hypothetical protein AMAG_04950 [Allomyces macrogynus ATCC 38327]